MRILLVMLVLLSAFSAGAQELPELLLMNTEVGVQPDGFGGETPVVVGDLFNHGSDAYVNINIFVEALDANDKVIGEGFGYLVDACGTALLDYALPPGRIQTFSAPFEVFAAGEVANVKLSFDAEPVSLESSPTVDAPAVHQIATGEVVMLEWLDAQTLIYGVGCAGDVFTELEWWRYSLSDGSKSEIEHPDAARVTPEMLEAG